MRRGAPPRDDHRSRLRLDDAAIGPGRGLRRRARPRAVHRATCWPGSDRRRWCCFVVAADEGWQAQSGDHRDAVAALGIRHGLLVITKSDRASERVDAVIARAREELADTGLRDAPAVVVSATTGDGLAELRTALDDVLARVPAARDARATAALGGPLVHHQRGGHRRHRNPCGRNDFRGDVLQLQGVDRVRHRHGPRAAESRRSPSRPWPGHPRRTQSACHRARGRAPWRRAADPGRLARHPRDRRSPRHRGSAGRGADAARRARRYLRSARPTANLRRRSRPPRAGPTAAPDAR